MYSWKNQVPRNWVLKKKETFGKEIPLEKKSTDYYWIQSKYTFAIKVWVCDWFILRKTHEYLVKYKLKWNVNNFYSNRICYIFISSTFLL